MKYRAKTTPVAFLLLFLLAFLTSSGTVGQTETKSAVVYVCACLKTKSCSCMTEAKMEGPCACGTQGGPPLKAVPTAVAGRKRTGPLASDTAQGPAGRALRRGFLRAIASCDDPSSAAVPA